MDNKESCAFLKGIALSCQDADTWIRRYKDTRAHGSLGQRPISVFHALEHTGKAFRLITESYTKHIST